MADFSYTTTNCNPPKGLPDSLDGNFLTVINGTLPDADTSFVYFDLAKAGFNTFALQFTIQNTTITFEASNSLPEVSNALAVWTDITNVVTLGSPGGPVSSISATGSLTVAFPLPWSRFRIRCLTTNATNAISFNLTRGRVN